jgi:ubiquitin-conjugating enzyme E2 variant
VNSLDTRQVTPGAVDAGYSRTFRMVEVLAIISFWGLCLAIGQRVAPLAREYFWLILSAAGVGFILADLVSGIVHWAADSWGSTEMPVLGKTLIRPFREHHVDPKAMTLHDYVETNGANCLISLPVALGTYWLPLDVEGWVGPTLFVVVSMTSMIFWVMMTNQIHKWSHLEEHQTPALVRWAQRVHLVMPPQHHQRHHTPPFDTYYCITTGWLNPPLHRLGVFRALERLVMATTGASLRRGAIGVVATEQAATKVSGPPERRASE